MAAYQQYKEDERKLHIALYENLTLLSRFYPRQKDVYCENFSKHMFTKRNRTAFNYVVFYLLNILDSTQSKANLPSWPPLDSKQSASFRRELVAYLKIINLKYPEAQIPIYQSSFFTSPGGYKIVVMLVKLSQIVMFLHLKRSGNLKVLNPGEPHKDSALARAQINGLSKIAQTIENETKNEFLSQATKNLPDLMEKSQRIIQNLKQVNVDITSAKAVLFQKEAEFAARFPFDIPLTNLMGDVAKLKQQAEKSLEVSTKFVEIGDLLERVLSLNLEHDKEERVPSNIAHIIPSRRNGHLDLIQYFQELSTLLESKFRIVHFLSPEFVRETVSKLEIYSAKYTAILLELKAQQRELELVLASSKEFDADVQQLLGSQIITESIE
ncbi:augmin complex subunit dgt6 [Euwallacea similis]|uniref:augmin complex subunit dgt6 n=1 Tax=Euwallacea similis TaxID=1736056 RepID=UPI00344E3E54